MTFIKQTAGLAELLAKRINTELGRFRRVVWLLPGGSNVALSVAAMALVDSRLSSKLVVMQTDERFVSPDSPDANWRQLIRAGLNLKQAQSYPVLTGDSAGLAETARNYDAEIARQFGLADFIIGQFGIGANGHIAGIMPGSSAAFAKTLAAGYQAEDFVRVTLTFSAISKIDAAYAFAFGPSKHNALEKLRDSSAPPEAVPAAILAAIKDSRIFNDQISEGGE